MKRQFSNSAKKPDEPISPAHSKERFLEELVSGASVRAAALSASVKPEDPYEWRKLDQTFAERWQLAEEVGTDLIEEEAFRRAVTGVEKPIYRGGEVVGHVADYSDQMLMFLLKARRPERYGGKAADDKLDSNALAKRLNLKGARDELLRKLTAVTASSQA